MADFNSTSGGIMPEDTAGTGGIEDNDLWEGFFDDEGTEPDGGETGGEPDNGPGRWRAASRTAGREGKPP